MKPSNQSSPEKPIARLFCAVERVPRLGLVALGLMLVYLTGYLDFLSDKDFSPQILYLIPVGVVAWCAGRSEGYLIAVNCGVVRLLVDWTTLRGDMMGLVPQWNAASFYVIAMTFAHLLSSLHLRLSQEQELARTDSLTGACNARSFLESAESEIERARRGRYSFAVAYIDCDNFKQVNDCFGHTTGDDLLQLVAQTLKSGARSFDLVARLGGDEFALLLPEVNSSQALGVMERLRDRLTAAMQEHSWPVTFSIGVATFITPPDSVREMLRQADEVMYIAKNAGKNQISELSLPSSAEAEPVILRPTESVEASSKPVVS